VKQIRKRITYANVMSSIAVFLVLGGASAYAAKKIGSNEIKGNSITTGKLKKNAVTASKIKKNSITTAKIKNAAVTGPKINLTTLGTVPSAANSATTNVIKASKGTLAGGQQATAFEYGPFKLVVKCETYEVTKLTPHVFIESSTPGSAFASWADGSKDIGPTTPETEREVTEPYYSDSTGPYAYDSPSDGGVSATAAGGQSFNAFVGVAAEKDTNTCWYWSSATIIS
jgi:hypothetical protein